MPPGISPCRPLAACNSAESENHAHPALYILRHPFHQQVRATFSRKTFAGVLHQNRQEAARRILAGRPVEFPGGSLVDSREPYVILGFGTRGIAVLLGLGHSLR